MDSVADQTRPERWQMSGQFECMVILKISRPKWCGGRVQVILQVSASSGEVCFLLLHYTLVCMFRALQRAACPIHLQSIKADGAGGRVED